MSDKWESEAYNHMNCYIRRMHLVELRRFNKSFDLPYYYCVNFLWNCQTILYIYISIYIFISPKNRLFEFNAIYVLGLVCTSCIPDCVLECNLFKFLYRLMTEQFYLVRASLSLLFSFFSNTQATMCWILPPRNKTS